MKKSVMVLVFLLVAFYLILVTVSSYAFFVGFGSSGGAEQVIKKGQDEGQRPRFPSSPLQVRMICIPAASRGGLNHIFAKTITDFFIFFSNFLKFNVYLP